MNDFIHNFDKKKNQIYMRKKPHNSCPDAPIFKVITQLIQSDIKAPYYAINLKSDRVFIKISKQLIAKYLPYNNDKIQTTTNITPTYNFVNLHIDKCFSEF